MDWERFKEKHDFSFLRNPKNIKQQILCLLYTQDHPYGWPGGYDVLLHTSDGTYCAGCVKSEFRSLKDDIRSGMVEVVGVDTAAEYDHEIVCENCNKILVEEYSEVAL